MAQYVWVVFSQGQGQGVCVYVVVYYTMEGSVASSSRAQSCQTDNTCIVTTDTVTAIVA